MKKISTAVAHRIALLSVSFNTIVSFSTIESDVLHSRFWIKAIALMTP